MLIVDLSLTRIVSTQLSQFLVLPTFELSLRSMVQCGHVCVRMRMTTITLRVQTLTLSSLE